MKKIFFAILIFFLIPVFAYEVYSPQDYKYQAKSDKLLFIIDFSNSMSEYLEHHSKINTVKYAMNTILTEISPETNIGLRVYGHTCNLFAYNACRSSELIVPLEKNNNYKINSALQKLKPKGMTPITYSLKQAVKKDLAFFDGIKHIILLTDGGENCDESPCDYAISLMKTRRDIKIDVIAFNVRNSDDLDQLRCTADVTGGKFSYADTNIKLMDSMKELTQPHKQVEAVIYDKN